MSLQVVAMLVIAGVGFLGQLALLAYYLGVKNNTIATHSDLIEKHTIKLDDHGNRIVSLEEWRRSHGGRNA